jgi:hypothetical protein
VQSDTLAARIVFERCNPVIVPFSVTLQLALRSAQLPALHASGPLGELVARQAEAYGADNRHHELAQRHAGLPDDLLNFQHDPLACAIAAGWDGVTIDTLPLIPGLHERSLTFTPGRAGKRTRVVTGVDRERFAADWLRAVQRADELGGR